MKAELAREYYIKEYDYATSLTSSLLRDSGVEVDGKPVYGSFVLNATQLLFNGKLNRWTEGCGYYRKISPVGSITGEYVPLVGTSTITVSEYGVGHVGNNPDNTDSNDPLTSLSCYYKIIRDNNNKDLYTGIYIPSDISAGENTIVYENALPYKDLERNENGEYEFKDKKTYLWRKDGYWHIGLELEESLFTLGNAEEPTGIWTWNNKPLEVVKVDNSGGDSGSTTATDGQ